MDPQDQAPAEPPVPKGVRADEFKRLTFKQRLFVHYYLNEAKGNASQAAQMAGYKHPGTVAEQIRRQPHIEAAIQRGVLAIIGKEEVLEIIAQQARADLSRFEECFDEEKVEGVGTRRLLNWAKVRERKLGYLVKSSTPGKYGDKIELYDAQRAAELLGKFHRLFADRVEERYRGIDLESLSEDELAKLAKKAQG